MIRRQKYLLFGPWQKKIVDSQSNLYVVQLYESNVCKDSFHLQSAISTFKKSLLLTTIVAIAIVNHEISYAVKAIKIFFVWDSPGGPAVKASPSSAGGVGSVPGS